MIKYVMKSGGGGGSASVSNSLGLLSLELNTLSKSPRSKKVGKLLQLGEIYFKLCKRSFAKSTVGLQERGSCGETVETIAGLKSGGLLAWVCWFFFWSE